jgi:predicted AAA+ superfamily ATPase
MVFENRKCKLLIQVCWELNHDNRTRESEGLLEAMKFFKKKEGIIITLNQKDTIKIGEYQIELIPVADFLSEI